MATFRMGPAKKKVGGPKLPAKKTEEPKKREPKKERKEVVVRKREVTERKPRNALRTMNADERAQLKSYFGAYSDNIIDMLELGDNDGGLTLLKKKLLQTVIRVLPKAEEILQDSNAAKGTYQFVTLISQIRELVADIQADKDKSYVAESLLERIIRPAMMDIAQEMMTRHHDFAARSAKFVDKSRSQEFREMLMDLAREIAGEMNKSYRDIASKMTEALKT